MASRTVISPFTAFDRSFARLAASALAAPPAFAWRSAPVLHHEWHGEDLELTVDLPGVPRDALAVSVADRTVTIAVSHAAAGEELRWSRSVALGGSLDPESLDAHYADGRLSITVKALPSPQARRVEIRDGRPAALGAGADTAAPAAAGEEDPAGA